MPEEIKKYIDEAYREALKAFSIDEVPVGAVIVRDGQIIGRGHNIRIKKKNALYHAEIVAIEDACKNTGNWRLDGATIFVTNEPCLMCAGAIMHARIKKVIFSSINEKMGAVLSNYRVFDKENPFKVEYEFIPDENSKKILKSYFAIKRGVGGEKEFADFIYSVNRNS